MQKQKLYKKEQSIVKETFFKVLTFPPGRISNIHEIYMRTKDERERKSSR
jgi:hypothetical protein